jgi:hypothetical protein
LLLLAAELLAARLAGEVVADSSGGEPLPVRPEPLGASARAARDGGCTQKQTLAPLILISCHKNSPPARVLLIITRRRDGARPPARQQQQYAGVERR